MQKAYAAVPMQDFNEVWTDEKLYAKYGFTDEEITYIESSIRNEFSLHEFELRMKNAYRIENS